MITAKKLLLTSTLFLALGVTQAHAADAQMDAQIMTRTAINVVVNTPIDFGRIDVDIADQAGTTITLPTTGSALTIAGGTAGAVVESGTPTQGQVTITTDGASVINVSCNVDAAMDNGAGDELAITNIQLNPTAGAAAGDNPCNATPFGITPTAADIVFNVGADIVLDATNNVAVGQFTYDTTTGGTPITITAVYP